MLEKIFNLFIFTDGELINDIGVTAYNYVDNDQKSSDLLQNNVDLDFKKCKKYKLPVFLKDLNDDGTLNYSSYFARVRLGRGLELFEEIFKDYSALASPLTCTTVIVNGSPKIDIQTSQAPFMYGDHQNHPKIGPGVMTDYLQKYMTPNGFDVPALLNNDYFGAIKLTFNEKYYVSCVKLIVSFIDTISYLEYGDDRGIFIKWLNEFCELKTM